MNAMTVGVVGSDSDSLKGTTYGQRDGNER